MSLKEMIDKAYSDARACNAIRYALDSDLAYYLYANSTPSQMAVLKRAVDTLDVATVKGWVRKHPARPLQYHTHSELIAIARRVPIKNYGRMPKEELIEELKRCVKLS